MNWLNGILNPEAVRSLYATDPPLNGGRLVAVAVKRDGSPVEVRLDLPRFPDTPPRRWHTAFNTAQVQLDLFAPYSVRFDGTLDDSLVRADLSASAGGGYRLTLAGVAYTLAVDYTLGRVAALSGYQNAEPPPPAGGG